MKKIANSMMFLCAVMILLASCGKTNYQALTYVKPEQQITGKGIKPVTINFQDTEPMYVTTRSLHFIDHELNLELQKELRVHGASFVAIPDDKLSVSIELPPSIAKASRKAMKKMIRKEVVKSMTPGFLKKESNSLGLVEVSTGVLVILAILLPPLAVGLKEGITTPFWINLILTLLGWLPGVIHALIVVLR